MAGATWMSRIPDDRYLTQLSIPGTHQSYFRWEGLKWFPYAEFALCQRKGCDIPNQLSIGVRFFDFRVENGGRLTHGIASSHGVLFSEVRCCVDFLNQHPSECVLISTKWEKEELFRNNPEQPHEVKWVVSELKRQFGAARFWFQRETPTLAQARGKIIFLTRWAYETDEKEGIQLNPSQNPSNTYPVCRGQDRFDMTEHINRDACGIKWSENVRPFLEFAKNNADKEPKTWFFNFVSAYAGKPPVHALNPEELAWGYRQYSGKGLNNHLEHYLRDLGSSPARLGIVIVDFVNDDLAYAIWKTNQFAG